MIWRVGRTLNSKDESVARKFRGVQRGRSRSVRTLGVESDADRRRDGLRLAEEESSAISRIAAATGEAAQSRIPEN